MIKERKSPQYFTKTEALGKKRTTPLASRLNGGGGGQSYPGTQLCIQGVLVKANTEEEAKTPQQKALKGKEDV